MVDRGRPASVVQLSLPHVLGRQSLSGLALAPHGAFPCDTSWSLRGPPVLSPALETGSAHGRCAQASTLREQARMGAPRSPSQTRSRRSAWRCRCGERAPVVCGWLCSAAGYVSLPPACGSSIACLLRQLLPSPHCAGSACFRCWMRGRGRCAACCWTASRRPRRMRHERPDEAANSCPHPFLSPSVTHSLIPLSMTFGRIRSALVNSEPWASQVGCVPVARIELQGLST